MRVPDPISFTDGQRHYITLNALAHLLQIRHRTLRRLLFSFHMVPHRFPKLSSLYLREEDARRLCDYFAQLRRHGEQRDCVTMDEIEYISVQAAARLLGISPVLLRCYQKRYGFETTTFPLCRGVFLRLADIEGLQRRTSILPENSEEFLPISKAAALLDTSGKKVYAYLQRAGAPLYMRSSGSTLYMRKCDLETIKELHEREERATRPALVCDETGQKYIAITFLATLFERSVQRIRVRIAATPMTIYSIDGSRYIAYEDALRVDIQGVLPAAPLRWGSAQLIQRAELAVRLPGRRICLEGCDYLSIEACAWSLGVTASWVLASAFRSSLQFYRFPRQGKASFLRLADLLTLAQQKPVAFWLDEHGEEWVSVSAAVSLLDCPRFLLERYMQAYSVVPVPLQKVPGLFITRADLSLLRGVIEKAE
uniref:Uncharacterized protein n=1 Tax=Thermosporothrix sp. COM3 TaxID=2490863 RepID=A0A455SH97_9CHLR|nr:hypothetical protein KTC_25940 [Thermosporothrix sp. COM3]